MTARRPAQEAERYDPKGVPIGGFKFFGTLEADEVFNDNIYAVSNATGKTAGFIQLINPTLELKVGLDQPYAERLRQGRAWLL